MKWLVSQNYFITAPRVLGVNIGMSGYESCDYIAESVLELISGDMHFYMGLECDVNTLKAW